MPSTNLWFTRVLSLNSADCRGLPNRRCRTSLRLAAHSIGGFFLLALLVSVPATVSAQDSSNPAVMKQLSRFTDELKSFTADFVQTVYDADSNPIQESSGTVVLKRPGRFIWNYTVPTEQQIIADGNSVWLYDIDLAQVTVNSLAEQSRGTPIALLMGGTALQDEFSIRALGAADGIEWVELTPREAGADFERVYIGLNDSGLAALELRDSFGQATQIRFSNFKPDVALDEQMFRFTPPDGVDVIGAG